MPIKQQLDNLIVGMKKNHIPLTVLLFKLPLVLETILVSIFEQAVPNTIYSPLLDKLAILPDMFSSNVLQSTKLVVFDIHLLAIQSVQSAEVVWGVYWSLSDIVLLAVTAVLLSTVVGQWQSFDRKQKWYLVLSAVLCWSVLFELWLSGCCTAGPDWWVEVVFLSKAYLSNPYIDTINWQGIYQKIAVISVPLRILLYIAGIALLRMSVSRPSSSRLK